MSNISLPSRTACYKETAVQKQGCTVHLQHMKLTSKCRAQLKACLQNNILNKSCPELNIRSTAHWVSESQLQY